MRLSPFFRLAAATLVLQLAAMCQTRTGEIRVTVQDEQGAAIHASLELSSQAVAVKESSVALKDGVSFKNLPFGTYRIVARADGFATSSQAVIVSSEVPLNLQIVLAVQAVQTTVEVNDSQTLLNTHETGAAYSIGAQQLKERPLGLAGRGLLDAIVMQPGWVYEGNGILHPRESEYDTQFVVNGLPLQDNRSPAFARPVQADDVQEVKAYTSSIPAEFGRKLGGVIEINTTRNTNLGWHGSGAMQASSFATADGYLGLQYVTGKTTYSGSGEGFRTDRYLDPPTTNNLTNHGDSGAGSASVEHDFNGADRMRAAFSAQRTGFQVPNDLLQSAAGQVQDRGSQEVSGDASYQHIFSPSLLGVVRARLREVSVTLDSNALSTPIIASQDRGVREGYTNGSLSGHHGHHEWKIGAEASYGSVREQFAYHITTYEIAGEDVFDRSLPQDYTFRGNNLDREQAVYAQDVFSKGALTLSAGIRFDHYSFLTDENGMSPRLGVAWSVRQTGTVLHASYDRVFETPPFENLLVSAAPSTRFGNGFFLTIHPARGNYYEAGLSQSIAGHLRLDVNVFDRRVTDFKDDDLLLNTGVSFPTSFDHVDVHGVEVKLNAPHVGRFSGFISYSNSVGTGHLPITGGLFLDDAAAAELVSHGRFPISQDQRNSARGWLRYQWTRRVWTSMTADYNSGLPVEGDELANSDFLIAEFGQDVLSKVNVDRGRVRPNAAVNASVGIELLKRETRSVTLQADVLNIGNRLNVINFAGVFSGTAIAAPRSYGVKLSYRF